jgi:hypothetical protein
MKNAVRSALFLLLGLVSAALAQSPFSTKMTSGPFLIAPTAASVDWMVVNNDTGPVTVRVTVYQLAIGSGKVVVPPGPVTVNLAAGATTHNANSVGTVFNLGLIYEVVVEADSDNVHPNVNQWSGFNSASFISGTLIPAGSFVPIKGKSQKP